MSWSRLKSLSQIRSPLSLVILVIKPDRHPRVLVNHAKALGNHDQKTDFEVYGFCILIFNLLRFFLRETVNLLLVEGVRLSRAQA